MSRIRNSKAFTLIELIVVVIIIGVLAGIAAVAYNQFVAQANTKANIASVKNVAQAMDAASASNNVGGATLGGQGSYTTPNFSIGTLNPVKVIVAGATSYTSTTGVFLLKTGCSATVGASTSDTATTIITGC